MGTVPVMFACNDYRNGNSQGWFDQFRFGMPGCDAEFEGSRTVIRRVKDSNVQIGRRIYTHSGWSCWVGNWCWDEICIDKFQTFLDRMYAKGFRCTCGPTDFYHVFNDGGDTDDIISAELDWAQDD